MRSSLATAQPSLGVQHSCADALLSLLPGVAGLGSMPGPKGVGQQAQAAVCLPPLERSGASTPAGVAGPGGSGGAGRGKLPRRRDENSESEQDDQQPRQRK